MSVTQAPGHTPEQAADHTAEHTPSTHVGGGSTPTGPISLEGPFATSRGEWVRERPGPEVLKVDAGLAALLAVASFLVALLYQRTQIYDSVAAPWVWVIGILFSTLPLTLRRRHPVIAAIGVSIGFFVCGQFAVPDMLIVQIALFMALYSIGAWAQNRKVALWSRVLITAVMFGWIIVNLIISSSNSDFLPDAPRSGIFSAYATFAVIQIVTNLIYFGGAFLFGERSWRGAHTKALLVAQGHELDLERQTSPAQAVALDRLGIARELHDVVAHHVSVMGIQAGAARRSLAASPERAAEALAVIESSAHTAITELHALVHTLRTPSSDDAATTVGVAQLPALVAASQAAGTPTTLIIAGDARPLPLLVDVALYRVAQEALTNVRKHAGSGAEATVRLRFAAAAIEVEVSDDGVRQRMPRGGTAESSTNHHASSGLGLRGMRERIGAVGGSVMSSRRERGGFMVRARVPLNGVTPEELKTKTLKAKELITKDGDMTA